MAAREVGGSRELDLTEKVDGIGQRRVQRARTQGWETDDLATVAEVAVVEGIVVGRPLVLPGWTCRRGVAWVAAPQEPVR